MPVETNAQPFIVDRLFKSNEIHLIFGPISEDNTALALYFLHRWREGHPIFSHASHPAPFVYVGCEQTESSLADAIESEGMDPNAQMTPHLSAISEPDSSEDGIESVLKAARERIPDLRVLFLDGIYSLCPKRIYDYAEVSRFLKSVLRTCRRQRITIIATATTAKARANEGYTYPRERLHGSGVWAAMTHTKVYLEPLYPSKVTDRSRVATVMPRVGTPTRFPFRYSEGAHAALRPSTEAFVSPTTLDTWLSEQPVGKVITSQELLVLAVQIDIHKATLYRWIAAQLETQTLTSTAHGTYVVAPAARGPNIYTS